MSLTEKEISRQLYRKWNLPRQLRVARNRVERLEAEARMFGMKELLTDPDQLNRAWEREIELARIEGSEK